MYSTTPANRGFEVMVLQEDLLASLIVHQILALSCLYLKFMRVA